MNERAKRSAWAGVAFLVLTFLFTTYVLASTIYYRHQECAERGCIDVPENSILSG